MNTAQISHFSIHEDSVAVSGATWRKWNGPALALALVIGAICFGVGGCVSDGYVGVSAYPDYSSYYGDYGYGGAPYYGYGGIYNRSLLVGGRRYSGGYGRHHFVANRGGGHRSSFSRSSGGSRGHFRTRGRH